jgi:hypothetical protein
MPLFDSKFLETSEALKAELYNLTMPIFPLTHCPNPPTLLLKDPIYKELVVFLTLVKE